MNDDYDPKWYELEEAFILFGFLFLVAAGCAIYFFL